MNESKFKLKKNCEYHDDLPANFICDTCGRSICYYCQRNYTIPYQCPECMPTYWQKKQKKEKIICFTPVVAVLVITFVFLAWVFTTADYDYYDDYSDVYADDDDIIPVLHEDTYNLEGNNEIDMTLKVYVTNWGTKKSGNVFIELYVMKNGAVRAEGKSGEGYIEADKTKIFELNTTIIVGEYDLQLMIWEDEKVVQKGTKTVKISSGDIEEVTSFDFIESADEKVAYEDEAKEDFSFPLMVIIILALIAVPCVIGGAWILYRDRTKFPKAMPPRPPGGGQVKCQNCGTTFSTNMEKCPKCGKKWIIDV